MIVTFNIVTIAIPDHMGAITEGQWRRNHSPHSGKQGILCQAERGLNERSMEL